MFESKVYHFKVRFMSYVPVGAPPHVTVTPIGHGGAGAYGQKFWRGGLEGVGVR